MANATIEKKKKKKKKKKKELDGCEKLGIKVGCQTG